MLIFSTGKMFGGFTQTVYTIQCFDIFVTFNYCSVKISCVNRNSWFVVHFTGYSAEEWLLWFTMWYSIKCFYTFITCIYISYFTNYSGKCLVKLTLSRHIACGYSFCSKILLSQNWTGSDILESLDISVNITQQIYYDGYRRVNM